jgi:hypothetical protein
MMIMRTKEAEIRIARDQVDMARDALTTTRKDHPMKAEYQKAYVAAVYNLTKLENPERFN